MSKVLLSIAMLFSCNVFAESVQLNSKNTVVWRGTVTGRSAVETQMKLAKLVVARGTKNYPLYLVLDSPGGSIEAGFMFIEFAKHIPNLHTVSIFAASMASAIAESLPGNRLVTENGTMMFHQAYAGVEGTVEVGSLETQLYFIKRRVQKLEQNNAKRMQLNLDVYKQYVIRELWLDSADSIKFRAADKIVDIVCSAELVMKTEKISVESIFGAIDYNFSACPLFRVPFGSSDARVEYNMPTFGKKQE